MYKIDLQKQKILVKKLRFLDRVPKAVGSRKKQYVPKMAYVFTSQSSLRLKNYRLMKFAGKLAALKLFEHFFHHSYDDIFPITISELVVSQFLGEGVFYRAVHFYASFVHFSGILLPIFTLFRTLCRWFKRFQLFDAI